MERNHSGGAVTTSRASLLEQAMPAASTSLRISETQRGSLLWERRFFLLTCFFRLVEQPERELRSALRLTAVEVMS